MANLFPEKHFKEKKFKNVEDAGSHAYIALIIFSSINYNMLH